MLQGISDATNIGIYHAVTTKISKQKNSNISNNDNNNNSNNKNKSNNFNRNSIDFTKIGHQLFLYSKSAPAGISDFHKMCIAVMKMYCSKQKPIFINVNSRVLTMMQWTNSVNVTLEKYAPSKARSTRANQAPYMNRKLNKEIMKRSRRRNKFLNNKSNLDRKTNKEIMWLAYREKKKRILW